MRRVLRCSKISLFQKKKFNHDIRFRIRFIFDNKSNEQLLAEYSYDEELFDTAVNGYATAAFTVLSGVITNQKCLDRYDELRNGLLGFKKQILFEKRYPFKYKFKLMLLWCSPKLYNKTIRKVRGA